MSAHIRNFIRKSLCHRLYLLCLNAFLEYVYISIIKTLIWRNIAFEDTTTLAKPTNLKWNSCVPAPIMRQLAQLVQTGASYNNILFHRSLQWMRSTTWRNITAGSRICLLTTRSMTYRPRAEHRGAHGGQSFSTLLLPPSPSSYSPMPNPSSSPAASGNLILNIRPRERARPISTKRISSRSKHTL